MSSDLGDDIPALPTAEAVPQAQLGADMEGGGALVVEGAQALEGTDPGGLESHLLGRQDVPGAAVELSV